MVPGGAAKGPCVLPAVLNSGSGMSMIGGKGLRCTQEMWPDVHVVFPYESKLTVAMADGWSTLLTQQTCLLTASVLTPWASVGIELAMAVLPDRDDVLILEPRALREKLNIDVMEGLKARALGSGVMEMGDPVAARRADTSGENSARQVSVSLSKLQRIADCEGRV